jgi:nicotinate dehydrogenase subunit B
MRIATLTRSRSPRPLYSECARAALRDAGFSRRDFLKTSGAMIVGFAAASPQHAAAQGGPMPGSPARNQCDSWIAINADGTVTGFTGKQELGQGISTAQMQLIAEELMLPFDRVRLIAADTASTPDQGYTSGSQSHPSNFNRANLAQACATAREALVKLASQRLGVAADQLTISNGVIAARNDSSKRATYAELLGGKRLNLAVDPNAKRRNPAGWTVLGKPIPRPDMAAMVTGRFEFVHNVRLPGMLHGRVVRPPAVGSTLVSVDESSVKSLPGFVKLVVRKDFVGVVAEKPWQAIQAANKLQAVWSKGAGLPDHATFADHLRSQRPSRDVLLVDSKDVDEALGRAAAVVKSTYVYPYQSHGSMGSSCAVADVQGGKATVYSASQGVWFLRNTLGMILNLDPSNIRVMFVRGSGCYGHNGADTVSYDAALLSQAVGRPVRVQLTRKDEMAWENYGNFFVLDQRAGLDAQGNIIAWDHEAWIPSLGNRPGPNTPGNVITGKLLGFEPAAFVPQSPAPPPAAYNNNSNGVPSYVAGRVNGQAKGTGKVASERVLVHNLVSPFWTGPLRSPQRFQNTFAHESFMDELAARAKADPVEFRLRHLSDPRLAEVVKRAAEAARWDKRPSPKSTPRNGIATGRGIACVNYEGDNGYSAMVAEVSVNRTTGTVTVTRMVIAADCGPISNPDGLRNQLEGGALQALSRVLGEEITWDHEKVTSIDWRTYHSLPLGFAVPAIECVLINRPEEEATGAGELSITIAAPAVANAIFDATGVRIRQAPFTPERVKSALA